MYTRSSLELITMLNLRYMKPLCEGLRFAASTQGGEGSGGET